MNKEKLDHAYIVKRDELLKLYELAEDVSVGDDGWKGDDMLELLYEIEPRFQHQRDWGHRVITRDEWTLEEQQSIIHLCVHCKEPWPFDDSLD